MLLQTIQLVDDKIYYFSVVHKNPSAKAINQTTTIHVQSSIKHSITKWAEFNNDALPIQVAQLNLHCSMTISTKSAREFTNTAVYILTVEN